MAGGWGDGPVLSEEDMAMSAVLERQGCFVNIIKQGLSGWYSRLLLPKLCNGLDDNIINSFYAR